MSVWHNRNADRRAVYLSMTRDRARSLERASSFVRWQLCPEKELLANARRRARLLGLPFDLRLSDIVIPDRCPLLGTELSPAVGKVDRASSPTLDRIRPELGYVHGNVWVISYRANTIKNDASIEELEALVHALRARVDAPVSQRPDEVPHTRRRRGKLSVADIECLRFWVEAGVQQGDLAVAFGISPSTLSEIKTYKRWNGSYASAGKEAA